MQVDASIYEAFREPGTRFTYVEKNTHRFSDCGCPSWSIWRISRPRFMFETTHRATFPAFRSH
ncbi:hypothetical protein BDZ89DRAFT_1061435 [Hymenopellis radicata]|nr:hypothetical protein BDZ89DRAFT_1061435 [Hymenopellis radicata]